MPGFAERLLVLKEHNSSLLQKIYNIKRNLEDEETKPFILKKVNANHTKGLFRILNKDANCGIDMDAIEKQQGYQTFVKPKIIDLLNATQPMYNTFCEFLEWTEAAQKVLEELATSISVEFSYELNIHFMSNFMDVLVGFAKLVMLVNKVEDRKLIVSLFNLAYTKVNGKSEENVTKIAQFFKDYSNATKKLQENFFTIHQTVGKALMNIIPSHEKGEMEHMNIKRPLELLFEPETIPYPSIKDVFFEIACHPKIQDWVLFGYLCCPEALGMSCSDPSRVTPKMERGISFLQSVLSQHYLVSLYGDEVLHIHKPYEEIFGRFKGASINLRKEKKVLTTAMKNASEKAGEHHKTRRRYLRIQMKTLLKMLQDSPGLIGPKFQLVMAVLTLVKEEILWYFRHANKEPMYHHKKWKQVTEPHIGEMIYLMDEMIKICFKHKNIIEEYHLGLIRNLFHKKVSQLYGVYKTRFEPTVVTVFDSILSDMQTATSFLPLRLNWLRVQIYLSGYQFKNSMKEETIKELFHTMNTVFYLTKHVDEVEIQLKEKLSLRELYYFENDVYKIFKDGLTSSKDQALYSMSFIQLLNTYPENAHKFLPELKQELGQKSVAKGKQMLRDICSQIETGIKNLRNEYEKLDNQLGGEVVGIRLRNSLLKLKEPDIPGFESKFDGIYIPTLRDVETNLTKLLYSLNMYNEITIYDTVFYPLEYLREKLEEYIGYQIQELANETKDLPNMNLSKNDIIPREFSPPSKVLRKLQVFMNALKVIEQCINIHIEELVLKAFLETFVHLNYVDSPFSVSLTGEEDNTIITYAKWYSKIIANVSQLKLLYVPVRRTFITPKESGLKGYAAETYLDFKELICLAQLVGPYGIRVIDQHLLQYVYNTCEKIREVLSQYRKYLKDIETNLYQENVLGFVSKNFKGFEKLFDLMINLGCLLQFRTLLHDALEFAVKENVPLIFHTVRDAQKQYNDNLFKDERLIPVDGLAFDCGNMSFDNALKKTIAPLCEQSTAWDVFGISMAILLANPMWKDLEYNVYIEGWNNNAHLAIHAFNELLVCINSIKATEIEAIKKEYEKFVEFASLLLLSMRTQTAYTKQINNSFIFADRIVKGAKDCFLDASTFESMCPYMLIRSVYIETYKKTQTQKAAQ